jgi:hypothetical protein
LWGKFELNFDLFSQKCWQILTIIFSKELANFNYYKGRGRADARASSQSEKHFFVTNTARIISSSFYL